MPRIPRLMVRQRHGSSQSRALGSRHIRSSSRPLLVFCSLSPFQMRIQPIEAVEKTDSSFGEEEFAEVANAPVDGQVCTGGE